MQDPTSSTAEESTLTRRRLLERGVKAAVAASVLPAGLTIISKSHAAALSGAKVSGTVDVVIFGTAPQQFQMWDKLFALFRQQHPDVKLKIRGIAAPDWATYFDTVNTQIAGGKVPDIVQVATEGQRLFVSNNLVAPIDEYLHRDAHELAGYFADVDPNFVKLVNTYENRGGHKYYLPGAFNTMLIWYSIPAFQKAGLPAPKPGWTWNEFLSSCQQLVKSGTQYAMFAQPEYFTGIMPWLLTNSANVVNTGWTKATVNSAHAVEAVTFMRQLVEQKLSPAPGGQFDAFGAMAQGKLAMFGAGRWPIVSMRPLNYAGKIGIVDWPQKTKKGSPVGWNSYPIMKGSKNKEAAWALVKFLTTTKAIARFAQLGGTIVPERKSVAHSNAFLANSPRGTIKLYNALSYATPIPGPNKENLVELAIKDALASILAGTTDVKSGLSRLEAKIQSEL
jgi:multiple sugar transport system substrate-binding protein